MGRTRKRLVRFTLIWIEEKHEQEWVRDDDENVWPENDRRPGPVKGCRACGI